MRNESSSSSSSSNCSHWFVRYEICLACKTKVSCVDRGRGFSYLFSGLRLSHEAVSFTKHLTTLISLYGHKKLHLVLDLDDTLINSVKISNLSEAEKYLIKEEKSGSRKDLQIYNDKLIKIRPFVKEFLREANKLFTMYAYMKAGSDYARAVVKMIDPNKTYFGDRVITRKESPDTKSLDLVLADERGIVIVDNALNVWPHHKRNLLEITSYVYFRNNRIKMRSKLSYAERKIDESRSRGALVNLLKFLKEVHNGFFTCGLEEELDSKDVRFLIKGPFKPKKRSITQ